MKKLSKRHFLLLSAVLILCVLDIFILPFDVAYRITFAAFLAAAVTAFAGRDIITVIAAVALAIFLLFLLNYHLVHETETHPSPPPTSHQTPALEPHGRFFIIF